VIDRAGTIVSRSFEEAYQERDTAASILAGLTASSAAPGATDVRGKYLTARLSASDSVAAPGHRVILMLDVTPGKNIHVYAPGQAGYIPIALKLEATADFKTGASHYPPARDFVFAPLRETVKVFDKPFRLAQEITLALTPALRQRATAKETLTIKGTLDYQACDDKVCFRPDSVPLAWNIVLTPIER
jgi:DsbC/DsbD-like thiol-disulfide interchange protein